MGADLFMEERATCSWCGHNPRSDPKPSDDRYLSALLDARNRIESLIIRRLKQKPKGKP